MLKNFIRKFKGVLTKYLPNYLVLNNFENYTNKSFVKKHRILLKFIITIKKKGAAPLLSPAVKLAIFSCLVELSLSKNKLRTLGDYFRDIGLKTNKSSVFTHFNY